MTSARKLLIATSIAALGYVVFKAKAIVNNFSFKIAGIGKPHIKAGVISVPVNIAITNPAQFAVSVKSLRIDLFIQDAYGWRKAGETLPASFQIYPGTSVHTLLPNIPVNLFGNSVLEAIANIATTRPVIRAIAYGNVSGLEIKHEEIISL